MSRLVQLPDIRDQKIGEQSQLQSGTVVNRILAAAPASVAVLDHQGAIVWTNEQWRTFGLENGAAAEGSTHGFGAGVNYLDVCRRAAGNLSEGAKEAMDGIVGVIESRIPEFRLNYPCHSPGQDRWFEMTAIPLDRESMFVIVIHSDITNKILAEEILNKSRFDLTPFVNQSASCMAMFDRAMNYLAISELWRIGYESEFADVIGRNHYQMHPDLPDEWKDIHQRCLAGATLKNDDALWIKANGESQRSRWVVQPWKDASGEIGGIIISAENITSPKKAEDALMSVLDQNIIRQTVAAMAHEVNQPLGSLSALCEAAIRRIAKKDEDGFDVVASIDPVLRQMKVECLRAGGILRKLLGMLQKPDTAVETIDVPVMLRKIAQNAMKGKYFDFRIAVNCGRNLRPVRANFQQVEHVIMNLIGNSADAMRSAPSCGDRIWLSAGATDDKSNARITIRDEGPGINGELVSQVFYPFVTTKPGGTGMGLAISRSLIEANSGKLWCEARDQPGATFCFTLPMMD